MMKKFATAALIAVTATTAANAGAPVDPIVEPVVIVEEATTSSSAGILVPLMLLILLGVALSGGSSTQVYD